MKSPVQCYEAIHEWINRPRPNILRHLPYWLSWWLGYRRTIPPRPSQYVVWIWSWIGAFCGLSVIMAVFGQAQYFINRQVPLLVASYGASAVLIYGAIEAPLAQPRALVGGHFIGSLIGVCVSKLFRLLPPARFEQLRWLSASISCATAIVAMQMTGTTHPPAGATALLPSVDEAFTQLGWYYLAVVMLSSTLALVVALIVNNMQRRYPAHWFTPPVPSHEKPSAALGAPSEPSLLVVDEGAGTDDAVGPERSSTEVENGGENAEKRRGSPV